MFNDQGVVRPASQNFPERFGKAFRVEMKKIISCIREGIQPEITAFDGLQAMIVAEACQRSIETNELVDVIYKD